MSDWTDWKDIESIKEDTIHKGCGVYKIRLANAKGSPIEIPRFLDKDKDGILMIGQSKNIERRIKYFKGTTEGKKYSHAEGQRLYRIKRYPNFRERHKNHKTQYSFTKSLSKDAAKKKEGQLLKIYFERFGEVPPLNNNLPAKSD